MDGGEVKECVGEDSEGVLLMGKGRGWVCVSRGRGQESA